MAYATHFGLGTYIYIFMEAVERILSIDNVYRHALDACLFLVFDPAEKSQLAPLQDEASDAPGKLVAALGIHVDDLLGSGDTTNDVYQKVKKQLRELFSFRVWEESQNLQYCGCDIVTSKGSNALKQSNYITKQDQAVAYHLASCQKTQSRLTFDTEGDHAASSFDWTTSVAMHSIDTLPSMLSFSAGRKSLQGNSGHH